VGRGVRARDFRAWRLTWICQERMRRPGLGQRTKGAQEGAATEEPVQRETLQPWGLFFCFLNIEGSIGKIVPSFVIGPHPGTARKKQLKKGRGRGRSVNPRGGPPRLDTLRQTMQGFIWESAAFAAADINHAKKKSVRR